MLYLCSGKDNPLERHNRLIKGGMYPIPLVDNGEVPFYYCVFVHTHCGGGEGSDSEMRGEGGWKMEGLCYIQLNTSVMPRHLPTYVLCIVHFMLLRAS